MKHFKLTSEFIIHNDIKLYRIELIINCKWGKIGDKGGFIEKEENISGNAWVYGDALVCGDAQVYGDARVYGDAWVSGDARVYGDAQVYGDAWKFSPLQIQGSRHFVNECKKGYLKIGCFEMTFAEWKLQYKNIGAGNGYSESEINEYGLYIDLAIKLSKLK